MTNETKQLTVADLEAAKKSMDLISRNNSPCMRSPICDPEKFKSANIAATCIGIVEEMLKLKGRNLSWGELKFSLNHIYEKAVYAFGNTPTNPASVASQLTDEEIETLAKKKSEYDAIDWEARGRDELHYEYGTVAAVLRDYVRLRKLVNAVKSCADVIDTENCLGDDYGNIKELKRLLAEAEKGGAE